MMPARGPDIQEVPPVRRVVQLTIVVLMVGSLTTGCSRFRSTPKSTSTREMIGNRDAPPTREVLGSPLPRLTTTLSTRPPDVPPTPQPSEEVRAAPSSTPPKLPLLTLDAPEPGQSIYSPVYVRGSGIVPFERTLEIQVLGIDGEILGRGSTLFDPITAVGERAVFEGTLPFRQLEHQQLGSVRVLMRSPRDGSVVDYAQVLAVLLPAGSGPTDITIDAPIAGTVVDNPVRVEGTALAPQNQVTARLKSGPAILAAETISMAGEIGEPGHFSVDLSYAPFSASASHRPGYPPPSEQVTGYVEVFYRSPKDGRITEIAAVPVAIPLSDNNDQ